MPSSGLPRDEHGLVPRIELYDSNGKLLETGTSADGMQDVLIRYPVKQSAIFRIRVVGANDTTGDIPTERFWDNLFYIRTRDTSHRTDERTGLSSIPPKIPN